MQTTLKCARIGLFVLLVTTAGALAADGTKLANIPLYFEANNGQADRSVKFQSRGAGYSFFLTSNQAVSVLADGSVVRMKWAGGNAQSRVTGLNPLPGKSNYLVGKDASRWRTDIEQFARVRYEAVYPGIDLLFYGSGGRLEYDLIVEPGADLSQVRFAFEGIDKLRIEGDGSLRVGQICHERPHSYQEINGKRQIVSSRFVLKGRRQVGFEVGAYDPSLPLVIDPTLGYSYKIAASGNDRPFGVAVDAAGNLYVTGWTNSPDFPMQGAFQGTYKGGYDAFVVKLNAAGDALVYATFLGGGARDHGEVITVDGGGNATVFGLTDSTDFPILNALQPTKKGPTGVLQSDTFLTKLNAAGNGLIFSTYFGGSGPEIPSAIGSDPAGNLYIAGKTDSNDFTTTAGAFQRNYGGFGDGFVCKINGNGQTLIFSSYLGGANGTDEVGALVADSAGNAYVTGSTGASNFPTVAPLQSTKAVGTDAFLARINASGSALVFSTFLGGGGSESGTGVALDASGNVYVAGTTASTNFPTRNPLQAVHAGGGDAFVSKFNPTGSALIYSTYLGGSAVEDDIVLAVTPLGSAFVFGTTESTNFPTQDPLQAAKKAGRDGFLTRIDPAGSSLTFSTYYGTEDVDIAEGMAISAAPQSSSSVRFLRTGGDEPRLDALEESIIWLIQTTYLLTKNSNDSDLEIGQVYTATEIEPYPPQTGGDLGGLSSIRTVSVNTVPGMTIPYVPDWENQDPATSDDPVITATGEFIYGAVDLTVGGPLPLGFSRYFANLLGTAAQARSFYGESDSAMGANWVHNFQILLRRSDASNLTVYYSQGQSITFRKTGATWAMAQPAGPTFKGIGYQLSESGTKLKMLDPVTELIVTFDVAGLADGAVRAVETIADRDGNTHTLTYNPDGTLQKVSDGLGRSLEFSYADGGGRPRVSRVTDQTGRSVQFEYDGTRLKSAADPRGKVTRYAYSGTALLESITLPSGNVMVRNSYVSGLAKVASQVDGAGNTTGFEYGSGTTTITDPLGNKATHTFNAQLRLTRYTDAAGKNIQYGYDSALRQTSKTDRMGDTSSVSYDNSTGKVTARTDAAGKQWRYNYTSQTQDGFSYLQLSRIDFPDGTKEEYVYDSRGNLVRRTDRGGHAWVHTYNARGQVATAANPDGGVTTYTYNDDGTVASIKDAAGNTTTLAYDSQKRPIRVTQADGSVVQIEYDAADQIVRRTNEKGKIRAYAWDDNGNLKTLTDELGKVWTLGYDANDRLTALTDPLGKTVALAYDARMQLKSATDGNGNTIRYGYDARARLVSTQDGEGKTWQQAYDDEGVLQSLTDPAGNRGQMTSDKLGRTTSVSDPLDNRTRYEYDALGRLTTWTNPVDEIRIFSYEARGLLGQAVEPGPIRATYSRNALGQITEVTDPRGKKTTLVYDAMGRPASSTDPLGNRTAVEYDSRNRPSRIQYPQGSSDISYDSVGLVTRAAHSDGTRLEYNYDDANRPVSASGATWSYDDVGRMVGCNGITIARDAAGRIASMTLAAGKTVQYSYDKRNFPVEVTDWAGGVTRFSYDDRGRMVSIVRPNGTSTRYTWDAAGRLTGIVETRGSATLSSVTLTRDGAGRTRQAARETPLTPGLGLVERSASFNDADQVVGWNYDTRGRLISDATRGYTWDGASRLASYAEGGNTTAFSYDALGNRIARTRQAVTRSYVWNYALGLASISVVKDGNATVRYYIHTPGGALIYSIEEGANARRFYHYDEMGSTLFLTDDSGTITDRYAYSPYGELAGSSGATDNPFTFVGEWGVMAEGNGLYYMRARYYDATAGRFLSRDPEGIVAANPRSTNPYQYARQNPVHYFDPDGRQESVRWLTPEEGETINILEEFKRQGERDEENKWGWTAGAFETRESAVEYASMMAAILPSLPGRQNPVNVEQAPVTPSSQRENKPPAPGTQRILNHSALLGEAIDFEKTFKTFYDDPHPVQPSSDFGKKGILPAP